MVNQCTKFEVSRFTRCEAMNGGAKCTNWGSWGVYGPLKVIGNVTIRWSTYDFLFDFNRNHASILYRFRDIVSNLSKVADFDPPHLHLAPPQGVIPVEFRGDLWHPKTRIPGLSCGVICVILRLAVLVELRLVTDRQTDRQTDTGLWLVPRMHNCIAPHGKNFMVSAVDRPNAILQEHLVHTPHYRTRDPSDK